VIDAEIGQARIGEVRRIVVECDEVRVRSLQPMGLNKELTPMPTTGSNADSLPSS
jgi:hypothetical protein